ncbi:MAG TPA: hypothetical protein VFG01_06270 [Acidobacteriota bacterium]|nr:hypothetical protein [Acidobacteriota bacterium]
MNPDPMITRMNLVKLRKRLSLMAFFISCLTLFSASCSFFPFNGMRTWQDYRNHSNNNPYILELNSHPGELFYFGAVHTIDLDDPQFTMIEQYWNQFKPDLALSEGNLWPVEATRKESIQKFGEQGLLMYLANRDSIPVKCIDPSRQQQTYFLSSSFQAWEIKMYFTLVQVAINRRMGWINSPERINSELNYLSKINYLEVKPFDFTEFKQLFSKTFPEIPDWRQISNDLFHRDYIGGFVAKIHKKLLGYRNQYMLIRLIREVTKGKRVFAVVGRSHVVIQEPFLKSALLQSQ